MKFAILPGSLRKDSLNKKLGLAAASGLKSSSHEVDFLDLKNFQLPLYDGDLEVQSGLPAGVVELELRIKQAEALIVVSPEYNGSIPGVLKNSFDWISRVKSHALSRKPVLVLTASPGPLGGIRNSVITQQSLTYLNAYVFPEVLCVGKAHEALSDQNTLKDEKTNDRLMQILSSFATYAKKLNANSN